MNNPIRRRGFTLIELLVVIFLIGIFVALLIPAIQVFRKKARRNRCSMLMQNLAIALHNEHDTHRAFPAAARLENDKVMAPAPFVQLPSTSAPGVAYGADRTRYSFLYFLLPFLEQKELYNAFDNTLPAYNGVGTATARPPYSDAVGEWAEIDSRPPRKGDKVKVVSNARLTQRSYAPLRCPSYSGATHATDNNGVLVDGAGHITNYKALGSVLAKDLRNADDAQGIVQHGRRNNFGKVPDGASNTIFLCETIEQRYAQWLDGTSAAIYGLESGCAAAKPLGTGCKTALNNNGGADFMPLGTVIGTDKAGKPVAWNPTNGQDAPGAMKWGPSSEHTGIVTHAFADGAVRQIDSGIDPTVYGALITRNGNDNKLSKGWLDTSVPVPVERFRRP